ncbi:hypothetical protein FT663_00660 [Candidozyma haemuli var. vulneris]|uniref:Cyclin n=1 Tax=Candidozyma haemuli TaxID=45357 RepID=A0A2V1APG6_9ASCO|nr:hypothetical protein CXQ85_003441 [[Candida] haemuloni]KAF3990793.1 hypothetical protein FT662_02057 [[Candida] haemuloni var. vulneris]KAF3995282.1 hypothetical protein FT663_00660 [[Candida] haemuloni var. vulneris]PVH19594.1 hypothetical protein CXQ85_003441 [[Candida] haemuloni]
MSRFNEPNAESGSSGDHSLSSSIFASSDSSFKPVPVSNLTKNLMSSGQNRNQPESAPQEFNAGQSSHHHGNRPEGFSYSRDPSSFTAGSVDSSNKFIPAGSVTSASQNLDPSQSLPPHSISSSFTSNPHHGFYRQNGNKPANSNMNYIPLGHNAPNMVSSSYTSNFSHTPSFQSASAQFMDRNDSNMTSNSTGMVPGMAHQNAPHVQTGFLPSSYSKAPMGHGLPTTNLTMNSVNSSSSPYNHGSDFHRSSFSATPQSYQSHFEPGSHFSNQVAQSLPTGGFSNRSLPPINQRSSLAQESPSGPTNFASQPSQPQAPSVEPTPVGSGAPDFSQINQFINTPDHYMTYDEYLEKLNKRDAEAPPTDENGYDEHLNIVKFPVNDLITMLACLLTKIIEANDKLHPNHFDTTIAIRQKLKEEKKKKKLEKEKSRQHSIDSMTYSNDGINTTVEHIDEDYANSSGDEQDAEDELKNRYLANVLAFHGTNIPGISLNAYLTRVLKYCPVTNEVFLSLLVYFDRIAKKANNLKKNSEFGDGSGDGNGDAEQLFVMDSYNIHRLIISGITVSSKFFSDIFYKNLRYAKVGGLPLEELNYLELQFLLLLDFKLMISVEDLQNYGDLLLKFWKREQLATDLVDTANKAEAGSAAANT